MSRHTPGPWEIGESHEAMAMIYAPKACGHVARVQSPEPFDYATKNANARLIAAAPELLAALEAMHGAFWGTSHNDDEDAANALAKAAIARARSA